VYPAVVHGEPAFLAWLPGREASVGRQLSLGSTIRFDQVERAGDQRRLLGKATGRGYGRFQASCSRQYPLEPLGDLGIVIEGVGSGQPLQNA
jgi:hypothetical protein